MNDSQFEKLSAQQETIVSDLTLALDDLPQQSYTTEVRLSYGDQKYQQVDIPPGSIEDAMDELKTFIQFATNKYSGQLAKTDIPTIQQFHVDKIPNGKRILIQAQRNNFNYSASIINTQEVGTFVSFVRAKKGLTGIGAHGPTHKPGEYVDFKIRTT